MTEDVKLFDSVMLSIYCYMVIAAAVLLIVIFKSPIVHPTHLHAPICFSLVSISFGLLSQAKIVDSLARKKSLRESVLDKFSLQLIRTQILFLVLSVITTLI